MLKYVSLFIILNKTTIVLRMERKGNLENIVIILNESFKKGFL